MPGTATSETPSPTTAPQTPQPAAPQPAAPQPAAPPSAEPPEPAARRSRQLALILVAAFMVVLDFSIVNVALPSIERELHMPPDAVQWIVTGYAISFGGLLILGGRAADLFGRRRMFIAGLIAFALASLAGGLARDPALLIAARVSQGAGAAIVAPAALSLITTMGTAGTAFGSVVLASRGMADSDQGLVGGMINTSRQIGAAIGAALLPAVAESVTGAPVSGDRAAMFTAGLAALAATAVAWHAAHAASARARTAS